MKKYVWFFLGFCSAAMAFLYWQDNGLMLTHLTAEVPNLPKEWEGYQILQISDLQSKWFGKEQKRLNKMIERTHPDMIVITGDLLDANRTDMEASMALIRHIVPLAPVYFVSGNHEYSSGVYEEFLELLQWAGVVVLENDTTTVEYHGKTVSLMGLADIRANKNYGFVLNKLVRKSQNKCSILLSHRPELFDLYVQKGVCLALSGHAHGGQIRLPFVGGLFAPNQGFLPQYTCGLYRKKGTVMVVSRGLGNSKFPFRLFNRPEVVEVTLQQVRG